MCRVLAIGILLALSTHSYAQSLADAAREARQKEKARPKASRKIITNEDVPESPAPAPDEHESAAKAEADATLANATPPRSAREWKNMILIQKDTIETLQAKINKLTDSIHFVTSNETARAFEYNQYQVKKQQEVKNLQKQLDEQTKKLGEMQDGARKEGMGTSVYDP